MTIRFLSLLALTFAVAIGLLFFSKPLANLISSVIGVGHKTPSQAQVGQVVEVVGRASFRRKGSTKFQSAEKIPLELFHQDVVSTGPDSLARIILGSGAEISMNSTAEILVEFFNPSDALSPVYITIRRGNIDVKKPGVAGRLFFIRNRKLLAPNQLDQAERISTVTTGEVAAPEPKVNITPTRPQAAPRLKDPTTPELSEDLKEALAIEQPIVKIDGKETLSSRYIESIFASKSAQFRRCQISSLRDRENALGRILYSFKINPTGKVTEIKILSATATSRLLQQCVTGIIERTTFEKYSGDSISLSYPIDFQ